MLLLDLYLVYLSLVHLRCFYASLATMHCTSISCQWVWHRASSQASKQNCKKRLCGSSVACFTKLFFLLTCPFYCWWVANFSTDFRSWLALDGTLTSTLTTQMASEEPCYKFEPLYSDEVKICTKSRPWCIIILRITGIEKHIKGNYAGILDQWEQ